ncbi:hydrogenase subunit MbhD domain-containing protein [Halobacillus sp. HZG1]|uniref:Na(+)/H(+) antiporter subunit B n=1 Tax=Halobacillus sp. HZG1 TaxID=3111769 RepID=UPI002DB72C3B|nr:hydrogenase subunit MbhD domain-containing protein [Halobacillus sp. HZG1]MEC3884946.1 hydrogenase subunit MbhD domain-containing protein [Halobacillus sp. HZG1]
MIDIIFNLLLIFLVITAFFIAFSKDLAQSVLTLPIFGTILVVIFVILQAPGVALAEVVMTAGLTTLFFVITINKTEHGRND